MFRFSDGSIIEIEDDLSLRADQNLYSEAERAVSDRQSREGPDQIWRDGIGDSASRIPPDVFESVSTQTLWGSVRR